MRLEQVWSDLKFWWNKFHTLKGGFVADDCQPNSAFAPLSDKTCLATFLGFNNEDNEDNELVKVMKALMMLQVTPYLRVQVHILPACVGNVSMAKRLFTSSCLQSHPLEGPLMCLVCLHSNIHMRNIARNVHTRLTHT